MIYADTALAQFREFFDGTGTTYETRSLSDSSVELEVNSRGTCITVWFDVSRQIYGFNMLQGGCKTYDSFDKFTEFFTTYVNIYSIFIPQAKTVVTAFEKELGLQAVYETFSGNKQSGYIAHFRVIDSLDSKYENDCVVDVSLVSEEYLVRLVRCCDDSSKVLLGYKYTLDEVDNVINLPTMDSYMNDLHKLYDSKESYDLTRTGTDEFIFNFEDLEISFKVLFDHTKILYRVLGVGNYEWDNVIELDNPLDLDSLYLKCKDYYNIILSNVEPDDDADLDQSTDDSDILESDDALDTSEPDDDSEDNSSDCDDSSILDETSSSVVDTLGDTDESDLIIKLVKDKDNCIQALQFSNDDSIYTISVDKAKSLGIPLSRISSSVSLVEKRGILMSEDEIASHKFAIDATDDDILCNKLFNSIFD